jgi:hypothetical protein
MMTNEFSPPNMIEWHRQLNMLYMMMDEFSPPNVVEWHRQLNMLIEAAICDL